MTANDVSQLPPELTRAGRLDAIWYHSLPTLEERKEIFKIHFGKANREIDDSILEDIAKETHNYTGAEIEQIVKVSLRKAFNRYVKNSDGSKEVEKNDIMDSIKEVIPIYESSKEKILALENWAKGRARSTSEEKEDYNYDFEDSLAERLRLDLQ